MHEIGVLAGDMRQNYITQFLNNSGHNATHLYNLQDSKNYIVPVPFTKDGEYLNVVFRNKLSLNDFISSIKSGSTVFGGNIPDSCYKSFAEKGIHCHDFLKNDKVVWENAYLTAEGLLAQIITTVPFSLKKKNILIIGYGKCGSLIAKLLKQFCNNIYIYDHTPKHLYELEANHYIPLTYNEIISSMKLFDVVVNTVPSKELVEEHYLNASPTCYFYEIASKPFGLDSEIIAKHNLNLITCPGIPGKFSPQTAGEIISQYIIKHLRKVQ